MKDLLKYGLIASAGQPRSLTGEALIGLGALLSQMDFDFSKDEDKKDERSYAEITEMQKDRLNKQLGNDPLANKTSKYLEKQETTKVLDKDYLRRVRLGIGMELPSRPVIQGSSEETQEEESTKNDQLDYSAVENAISKGLGGMSVQDLVKQVESGERIIPNTEQEERFAQGKFRMDEREAYMAYLKRKGISGGNVTSTPAATSVNQITTNVNSLLTPANRLKPEVLKILDGARYKNKGKDDTPLHRVAHVTNSPYLRTDNVDYRQMRRATAPGYTGEIGKAAIEGYNLVIDKYNYDQAVKADYEEELEDQMGSLNVEADFLTDEARENYLELASQKKKEFFDSFNKYTNGEINYLDHKNNEAKLKSELQAAAATRTNITNAIKDFIENKGTIDVGASDREMLDFLMTGEKSPERISIKNIDGVDYITGTTRGGRDFQVPTSKIANGTASFRVVKKANLAPIISGALKNINAYTSSVKTDLGFGVSTPSPKKARQIGIASIRNTLGSNEADLRSIMYQIYGVDHTAYQNFLGSDPAANKSAMLDDAAEHLYDTQVAEKYFPMTKTTKFRTEKTGSTTAGERDRQLLSQSIANLPSPTAENFNQYKSLIDTQYDYMIKDGKLLIGLKGKKKDEISLTDPSFKSQFSRFAKLPAYIGQQQDLSGYNFDL